MARAWQRPRSGLRNSGLIRVELTGRTVMTSSLPDRRSVLSALALVPLAGVSASAAPQNLPPIEQPAERTRAAYFARAGALRDRRCAKAIRPMAPWWCATGSSSERAETTSCCTAIRPRTPIAGGTRCGAARHARSVRLRCLFHRDALRDVPGRALLGPHPPRLLGGEVGESCAAAHERRELGVEAPHPRRTAHGRCPHRPRVSRRGSSSRCTARCRAWRCGPVRRASPAPGS